MCPLSCSPVVSVAADLEQFSARVCAEGDCNTNPAATVEHEPFYCFRARSGLSAIEPMVSVPAMSDSATSVSKRL